MTLYDTELGSCNLVWLRKFKLFCPGVLGCKVCFADLRLFETDIGVGASGS